MSYLTSQNPEQYYKLELEDCACPSFCSFTKDYYGDIVNICAFIDSLAADNKTGRHNDLINAFKEWENGNISVTRRPAYHECQLLTPEVLIARENCTFEDVVWRHTNLWGCIRNLRADKVNVSQIILSQGDRYIICIRPVFENLMVFKTHLPYPAWMPVGDRFWGFPGMMVTDGKYTYPRLFLHQKSYQSLQEAITDLNDETKIDYTVVCDEIFGDG